MKQKLFLLMVFMVVSNSLLAQKAASEYVTWGDEKYSIINIARYNSPFEIKSKTGGMNLLVYINDSLFCELPVGSRVSIRIFSEGIIKLSGIYIPNDKPTIKKEISKDFFSEKPLEIKFLHHGETYFLHVNKIDAVPGSSTFLADFVSEPDSYTYFIDDKIYKKNPSIIEYQEEGSLKLAQLNELEDWNNTQSINTIKAYIDFQKRFPGGKYLEDSKEKLVYLKGGSNKKSENIGKVQTQIDTSKFQRFIIPENLWKTNCTGTMQNLIISRIPNINGSLDVSIAKNDTSISIITGEICDMFKGYDKSSFAINPGKYLIKPCESSNEQAIEIFSNSLSFVYKNGIGLEYLSGSGMIKMFGKSYELPLLLKSSSETQRSTNSGTSGGKISPGISMEDVILLLSLEGVLNRNTMGGIYVGMGVFPQNQNEKSSYTGDASLDGYDFVFEKGKVKSVKIVNDRLGSKKINFSYNFKF
jgi:hypothetical protein